jgi:KDO2-lipid IV(A) lauroyltransferase
VILNTPLVSCYKLYESPFWLIFARKKLHAISYIYYSLPFSLDDFYPSIPSFLFVIGCVILLVYYVVGYRKNRQGKYSSSASSSEPRRTSLNEKKSYSHLCDMFMEMTKP